METSLTPLSKMYVCVYPSSDYVHVMLQQGCLYELFIEQE